MLKKMKRIVFYKSIVVLACAWCSAATAADTLPPLRDGQSPNDFEAMWAGFDPRAEPLETETLKEWEEDDVNLRIVMELRKNIKKVVEMEMLSGGTNKRKLIQKAVFNELVSMLSPGREPFKPKKGQPNVIMFVGLQGSGVNGATARGWGCWRLSV